MVQNEEKIKYDCMVFHDIDMIAVDERLSYDCDEVRPVHLASKRWSIRHGKEVPLKQSFGAVSSLTPRHFLDVNGYSNKYWGWGAEDDDL